MKKMMGLACVVVGLASIAVDARAGISFEKARDGKSTYCQDLEDARFGGAAYELLSPQVGVDVAAGKVDVVVSANFLRCVLNADNTGVHYIAHNPAEPFSFEVKKPEGSTKLATIYRKNFKLLAIYGDFQVATVGLNGTGSSYDTGLSLPLERLLSPAEKAGFERGETVPVTVELTIQNEIAYAFNGVIEDEGLTTGTTYILSFHVNKNGLSGSVLGRGAL